jgi:hypothetical protein
MFLANKFALKFQYHLKDDTLGNVVRGHFYGDIPSLIGIPLTQRVCPLTFNFTFLRGIPNVVNDIIRNISKVCKDNKLFKIIMCRSVKFYLRIGLVAVKSISSKKDARGIVSGASK